MSISEVKGILQMLESESDVENQLRRLLELLIAAHKGGEMVGLIETLKLNEIEKFYRPIESEKESMNGKTFSERNDACLDGLEQFAAKWLFCA